MTWTQASESMPLPGCSVLQQEYLLPTQGTKCCSAACLVQLSTLSSAECVDMELMQVLLQCLYSIVQVVAVPCVHHL